MRKSRLWSVFSNGIIGLLLTAGATSALAVVSPDRSRVIIDTKSAEESLLLSNTGTTPSLIQMWIDDGDPLAAPDHIHLPLVILPPIFSINAGQQHDARIKLLSPETVGKTEKLYWINIYQVPPNTQLRGPDKHQIVMPLRVRMKLIVRPASLGELQETEGNQLDFRISGEGQKFLDIYNPGKRVITISAINLNKIDYSGETLLPNETKRIAIATPKSDKANNIIAWSIINDRGINWNYHKNL